MEAAPHQILMDEATVRRRVTAALSGLGFAPAEIASTLTSWLYAEYSGKTGHGLERLPWLTQLVTSAKVVPAQPLTTTVNGFHTDVSGERALGYSAADAAVSQAVRLGREKGLAVVTMAGCYPTGCMGQYTEAMVDHGLIGIAISHSPARVAPYGGASAVFSTTGHSFGFPSAGPVPFIYDSSVGAVTNGQVMAAYKANAPVPAGVLSKHSAGQAERFDEVFGTNGAFDGIIGLAGGDQAHKVSGWAGSLELLMRLALLPGAGRTRQENYSIFVAIDPAWFGDAAAYRALVSGLQASINGARPAPGAGAPQFPGERSFQSRARACREPVISVRPGIFGPDNDDAKTKL